MRSAEFSIVLPVPPERAFAALGDIANVQGWLPQIVRLEVEGGGPVKPGAVLVETRRFGKREVTAKILVEEHAGSGALPHRHTASSTAAGVCCRYRYEVHAHPEGCRMDLRMEAEGHSFFGKLVAGGLLRMLAKQDGNQLLRLREMLTEGAASR
jgi:Polyketide cyclase / dehydrase and lipid transport